MTAAGAPLPVGSPAPELGLRDQHGATASLADLRGRAVLLVFYPFTFSRVCGDELAALDRALPDLQGPDSAVLAVSCDPVHTLRAYADRTGIDIRLLSDFWPHGAVSSSYGVLDPVIGAPHRSTFVLDHQGAVRWSLHVPRHESRPLETHRAALAEVRRARTP